MVLHRLNLILFGILAGWLLAAVTGPTAAPTGGNQGHLFIPLANVTLGTVTASQLDAADRSRIALVCVNKDTVNGATVGGSTAPTSSKGVVLGPGAAITVTATDQVQAIALAGAPVIACTKEVL